jgi:GNAT superfamily N-acetyltransferase
MIAAPQPLRAWVNPHLAPTGCIGAHTGPDPVARIREAEDWLRTQGCTQARAPLDGSTWQAYRANIGPHNRPPFLGEPDTDPAPWRDAGYTEAKRYCTLLAHNAPQISATRKRDAALRRDGWRLDTLDALGSFDDALDLFFDLSLAAFTKNFSYSPIDHNAFKALYRPLQPIIRPDLVLIARSPEDEVAGFCFSYPDLACPSLKQVVIKTLAASPAHRGLGLGSWMVGEKHRIAEELGYTGGCLHALMASGNTSQRISRAQGALVREYILFEKTL